MHMTRSGESDVDYSDFEYDQMVLTTSQDDTGNGTLVAQYEPLGQQGGLRPNQVAEIVAVWLDVSGASAETILADNSEYNTFENRGVVGVNLDEGDDISSQSSGVDAESVTVTQGSFVNNETGQVNEPGLLVPYRVVGDGRHEYVRNWRDTTGRGPVIDANDDISIVHTSVSESPASNDFAMTAHFVYDVFETDDSRTEFSVPR